MISWRKTPTLKRLTGGQLLASSPLSPAATTAAWIHARIVAPSCAVTTVELPAECAVVACR